MTRLHAAPRSESVLVKAAIERIRAHPRGHAVKVHGSVYTAAGEPDIDGCINGRALHLEAKLPGNKPTPVQYGAMRRWAKTGALVGWFTSLDGLEYLLSHVDDPDWSNPQLEREG